MGRSWVPAPVDSLCSDAYLGGENTQLSAWSGAPALPHNPRIPCSGRGRLSSSAQTPFPLGGKALVSCQDLQEDRYPRETNSLFMSLF